MPRSTFAVLRPAARRGRRAAAAAGAALVAGALASSAATPAHAAVDRDSYMRCVDAVASWTDGCRAASDTIAGDIGCIAVGTVGILGCAALEAIEQLGKGISLQ